VLGCGEPLPSPADFELSHFDASGQTWQLYAPFMGLDPGFRRIDTRSRRFYKRRRPSVLAIPDLLFRIRYYHQDHLGSSA
jgi:hypothetical protein